MNEDIEDTDLLLAHKLQEEFDKEDAELRRFQEEADAELAYQFSLQEWEKETTVKLPTTSTAPGKTFTIVDKFWELNDPNPDIHALFILYNKEYFWDKLDGVEVRWSPRMTLCAGICCYEGKGGLCSIRLSLPLLKLRPRKDLVETLLHEMIHAYLFVTQNNRDHNAHGPEFHKHMHRINKESGTNITVYHNFHDEVDSYRVHWWQCTGPCRNRPPYNGIVKRAMNRAPSPNDFWWNDHAKTCGGNFVKIKQPEPKNKKRKGNSDVLEDGKKKAKNEMCDIRNFLKTNQSIQNLNSSPKTLVSQKSFVPFIGKGFLLGTSTPNTKKEITVNAKQEGNSVLTGTKCNNIIVEGSSRAKEQANSEPTGMNFEDSLSESSSNDVQEASSAMLRAKQSADASSIKPKDDCKSLATILLNGRMNLQNVFRKQKAEAKSILQEKTQHTKPMFDFEQLLENVRSPNNVPLKPKLDPSQTIVPSKHLQEMKSGNALEKKEAVPFSGAITKKGQEKFIPTMLTKVGVREYPSFLPTMLAKANVKHSPLIIPTILPKTSIKEPSSVIPTMLAKASSSTIPATLAKTSETKLPETEVPSFVIEISSDEESDDSAYSSSMQTTSDYSSFLKFETPVAASKDTKFSAIPEEDSWPLWMPEKPKKPIIQLSEPIKTKVKRRSVCSPVYKLLAMFKDIEDSDDDDQSPTKKSSPTPVPKKQTEFEINSHLDKCLIAV